MAFLTIAPFVREKKSEMCKDSSLPSVVSSRAHNETISVCEAHISQVGWMAQKAFVFALKQIRSRSSTAISHKSQPVEKRVWQFNLENNVNGKTSVGKWKDSGTSNFPFAFIFSSFWLLLQVWGNTLPLIHSHKTFHHLIISYRSKWEKLNVTIR